MAKILVVDDDAAQRLLCQKELEADYETVTVENGTDAIEELKKTDYDLVVLDIRMPKMDGIEVLGKMISLKPELPVILYSSFDYYKDNFLSWSADAYVVKSSSSAKLKAKIKELLGKRKPKK
jgi:CheY-like chemotaxis protein